MSNLGSIQRFALAVALTIVTCNFAFADGTQQSTNDHSAVHDAWVKGKVEMALLLNGYLNSFRIHTDVKGSAVTLTGAVDSDIDSDLAEQVALGVSGVDAVHNELKVDPEPSAKAADEHADERKLTQRIKDATTTARVKSKLLMNHNVAGTRINVDTTNNVVTLNGEVNSGEERDLAYKLAKNTSDVTAVKDRLEIKPEPAVAGR